jgi:hypothetical protein
MAQVGLHILSLFPGKFQAIAPKAVYPPLLYDVCKAGRRQGLPIQIWSIFINDSDSAYSLLANFLVKLKGRFSVLYAMYFIQHCSVCRPSDSAVSEDAEIEPRTVATSAFAVIRFNHSARSRPHSARSHPYSARSHPH